MEQSLFSVEMSDFYIIIIIVVTTLSTDRLLMCHVGHLTFCRSCCIGLVLILLLQP